MSDQILTKRAPFITLEGPEGSGKSTQARMLTAHLRSLGRDVLDSAEPGGTPIGMQIRRVLLDAKNADLCPTAELLLMFAARAQNVDQWILPALAAGRIVISDRFTDSTLVYQGAARDLGADVVYDIDRIACRGLVPDLTLVIDIDTEVGLARAHKRSERTHDVETRLDQESFGVSSQGARRVPSARRRGTAPRALDRWVTFRGRSCRRCVGRGGSSALVK